MTPLIIVTRLPDGSGIFAAQCKAGNDHRPHNWIDSSLCAVGIRPAHSAISVAAAARSPQSGTKVTELIPETVVPVVGQAVSNFPKVLRTFAVAHPMIYLNGVIGFDTAPINGGPAMSELNPNPLRRTYQRPTGIGF